jgi:uncharacterized membrane protein
MNKMTRQQKIITFLVVVVLVSCALLDVYEVAPRFKMVFEFIGLPCIIYLFFIRRAFRRRDEESAPSRFILATYYYVFRFAGFWFLILGSIMAVYLTVAMMTHQPHFPVSDIWPGAVGSAVLAGIGFWIIRFRPFKNK